MVEDATGPPDPRQLPSAERLPHLLSRYGDQHRTHAVHHASTGNLERRGLGDIETLTVQEYLASSRRRRLAYRMYARDIRLALPVTGSFVGAPGAFLSMSVEVSVTAA